MGILTIFCFQFCNSVCFTGFSFVYFCWFRIVESVGEGVTDLKPGDHVLPVPLQIRGEQHVQSPQDKHGQGCDDWLTANRDSPLMASPSTTLWELPPSASTLFAMLAASPRSTLLLLWTKFVFSAVESLQVAKIFLIQSQLKCNLYSLCFFD